ncbi:unnamed protein product [Eruca vesicaria subsp. sativa]|uniref:Uncharacterized protein n=1 Tax=Eruca vesicaria subsp. sativa TaxID=29727 RepID=A0ABC8LQF3_ERUVS|nr:unnamed protein product [Eruca vesicaria subsp. sativa]
MHGFVIQGKLLPHDSGLANVFRLLDRVQWAYTVLHVCVFFPRIVGEMISNLCHRAGGVVVRGAHYRFDPDVINTIIYHVSERNWLQGPDTDAMIKLSIRLIYALINRCSINFGELVYDQVITMAQQFDEEKKIIFLNLLYHVLLFQKEPSILPEMKHLFGRGSVFRACQLTCLHSTTVD